MKDFLLPEEGPYSASSYIVSKENYILAVSRKDNQKDFGLPGGKLDPGENFLDACIRETMEETGLNIWKAVPIFGDKCGLPERDIVHWNMVFLCYATGQINTQEKGKVIWTKPYRLIKDVDGNDCRFSQFNQRLLDYFKSKDIKPFLSDVTILEKEIEL